MRKHSPLIRAIGIAIFLFGFVSFNKPNTDPNAAKINTSDLENFWKAFDQSKPDFDPRYFDEIYLSHGSKGLEGFMQGRIRNAEYLAETIKKYPKYYSSIRSSLESIAGMEPVIKQSFVKLKEIYPEAIFPPVYFVVGALNSGGTISEDGIIIGAEMYGVSPKTDTNEVSKNQWLQSVVKPVSEIPHIVAHELIHIQHSSLLSAESATLLEQSIIEGSADFLGELISGKLINEHIHDFANPIEKELWKEFKEKMHSEDYEGWLYSSSNGRPNDLGYWQGYKITKAYYDNAEDKKKAIYEILNIKNFNEFLDKSGYIKLIEGTN